MKKSIVALSCAVVLAGLSSLLYASQPRSCTTLKTAVAGGLFNGEICIDPDTQMIRVDGVLAVNGLSYRLEANGTIKLDRQDGEGLYEISGTETIFYPSAGTIGSVNVYATGTSLTNAATRFATKAMNIPLP